MENLLTLPPFFRIYSHENKQQSELRYSNIMPGSDSAADVLLHKIVVNSLTENRLSNENQNIFYQHIVQTIYP